MGGGSSIANTRLSTSRPSRSLRKPLFFVPPYSPHEERVLNSLEVAEWQPSAFSPLFMDPAKLLRRGHRRGSLICEPRSSAACP